MLTGLKKRGKYWHIKKTFKGRVITGTTGETERARAEEILLKRMEEIRDEDLYGITVSPKFEDVLVKYCDSKTDCSTIDQIIGHAETLIKHLGKTPIDRLNNESFDLIRAELHERKNLTPSSVNRVLEVARAALRACYIKWRDEYNKPLLAAPVHIEMYSKKVCKQKARRRPYPLNPKQELAFFNCFSPRAQGQLVPLRFVRNTGLRDQECCSLSWDMEQHVEEINRSIFFIDGSIHKNGYDRIVVLNDLAWEIVESQRNKHPRWVFPSLKNDGTPKPGTDDGRRGRLTTKQFQAAWVKAELPTEGFRVGVHNFRYPNLNKPPTFLKDS